MAAALPRWYQTAVRAVTSEPLRRLSPRRRRRRIRQRIRAFSHRMRPPRLPPPRLFPGPHPGRQLLSFPPLPELARHRPGRPIVFVREAVDSQSSVGPPIANLEVRTCSSPAKAVANVRSHGVPFELARTVFKD